MAEDEGTIRLPVTGRKSTKGASGGGSSGAPDTLFSIASVKIVDAIGEGVLRVVGGLKGLYLNDVPVQNADGSFTVKGLRYEAREGYPDQTYLPGYPDVDTSRDVGVEVKAANGPIVRSISDPTVDRIRVTLEIPALMLQKSDGSTRNNYVNYRIEVRYYNGPWVNVIGDQHVEGKCTSPFFVSHEMALPQPPSGEAAPWQVQVTKTVPDVEQYNQSQTTFVATQSLIFYQYTEIVDAKLTYPSTAYYGLTADASLFGSSVPQRRVLVERVGQLVPSNYDTAARTYAGLWDGTFKEADVQSNPAWALYDLLTNSRYGLGQFVDPAGIDKWALYDVGRYCDQLVSDGTGGQEPRFSFNGAVTDQQEAFDLVQMICQVFRGMAYWASGAITVTQDRPADPVLLVSEANVVDGELNYTSSARRARHNAAVVTWHDPRDLYRTNYQYVEDVAGIAAYGYNPTNIDLLGCTSRGQAYRAGLWLLLTELHETQVLTYKAGLDHAVVRPGDLISVVDAQISNLDNEGRVLAAPSTRVLVLDRPVDARSGEALTLFTVLPDGTTAEAGVESYANTPEGRSRVVLAADLPVVPDPGAMWQIAGDIVPQIFRVVTITETESHVYAVSAVQHEPSKFAAVDDGAAFVESPISEFPYVVLPPTNLSAYESSFTVNGSPVSYLLVSWTPGQPFNTASYNVSYKAPDGTVTNMPPVKTTSVEIPGVVAGLYTIYVSAVGINKAVSQTATIDYTVAGWQGANGPKVVDLQVVGGGTTFAGRSCPLQWRLSWPAGTSTYPTLTRIRVLDADTGALVYQEDVPGNTWTFDYNTNASAPGGPRRRFKISATALDLFQRESQPTVVLFANPAPDKISLKLGALSEYIIGDADRPGDADLAGYLFWISTTSGFKPTDANVSADAATLPVLIPAQTEQTYYVRGAAYDAFSKKVVDLNLSDEKSIKVTIRLFDPSEPTLPGKPTLATAGETAADGTFTASVSATWTASTGNFGGLYLVALSYDGVAFTEDQYQAPSDGSAPAYVRHGLPPNQDVYVKVRAQSSNAFKISGYGPVAKITTARSGAVPDNPTGPSATATYQGLVVRWTAPQARDLRHVEVWSIDGTSTAAVPPAGALLQKVAAGATTYFDNTVPTSGTRTYWLRSVSTSDVSAAGYTGPVSATNPQILAAQLAAGIIDSTKLASSITAPTVVDTLPTTYVTPFVVLRSDGKLYRWDSAAGKYTAAVAAGDVSGQLSDAQIAGLAAAKISGQLSDAQLAALSANKLVGKVVSDQIDSLAAAKISGQLSDAQIAGLAAAKISGQLSDTQIAALSANKLVGKVVSDQIDSLAAAKIAGQLSDAQIAGLAAAKISGQLSDDQLAALSANKLVGKVVSDQIDSVAAGTIVGQLTSDQIAALAAAKISGQLSDTQLAALSANKLVGKVVSDQIDSLAAAKIAGQLTDTQIAGLAAAKLTGQITTTQITDNAISTPKLAAGAVVAGTIAAGAVTTSKLQVSSQNLLFNADFAQGLSGLTLLNGTAAGMNATMTLVTRGLSTALQLQSTSAPTASTVLYALARRTAPGGGLSDYAVGAGVTVEFSVAFQATNCTPSAYLQCLDASSSVVGTIASTAVFGGRVWCVGTTPAGTVSVRPLYLVTVSSGAAPTVLFWQAMFALAAAGQTEPSPYVDPGVTTITGGNILTNTIAATSIVANSITTAQIQAGGINADRLVANSITAAQIAAATITGTQIAAQTITAGNLAAGSVTTSKLAVASANICPAGDATQGTRGFRSITDASSGVTAQVLTSTAGAGPDGGYAVVQTNTGTLVSGKNVYVDVGGFDATTSFLSIPVTAGQFYEASAYPVGPAGFTTVIQIVFRDASNAVLGVVSSPAVTPPATTGGTLATRIRCFAAGAAPTGATNCYLRVGFIAGTDIAAPVVSVAAVMLTASPTLPTEASRYVRPGVTVIDGSSIVTGSIAAAKIVANSITTAQIQAGGINADRLVANSITAAQIAAATITGTQIAAQTITAGNLAAGSVTTSKLTVASQNLLFNADFAQGLAGLTLVNATGAGMNATMTLSSQGTATALVLQSTSATTAATSLYAWARLVTPTGALSDYPIGAGVPVEFSVAFLATNCSAQAYLVCVDGTGAQLSVIASTAVFAGRVWVVGTTPAGTAAVRVFLMANVPSGVAPVMRFWQPMFALAAAGQTEPSPYVDPGVTTITGGNILTNTIAATSIVANSITTAQIQAGGINADRLVANSITAAQIAAATITGTQIAAQTITAGNLAAGSVTTSKLQVASQNLLFNADFAQGTSGVVAGAASGAASTVSTSATAGPQGTVAVTATLSAAATSASSITVALYRVSTTGSISPYPVTPGVTYELSAYLRGTGITSAQVVISWYNGTTPLSQSPGSVAAVTAAAGAPLSAFGRSAVVAVAPATATLAYITITAAYASGSTPNLVAALPMFALAAAGQTEPSPYVDPGVTTITGGNILTNTIAATSIVANSITTAQIQAGGINADRLVANSITAAQIAAATITGTQIAATTITAGNLAAGSVTTSKLQVASQNLLFNADLAQGLSGLTLINGNASGMSGTLTLVTQGQYNAVQIQSTSAATSANVLYSLVQRVTPSGGLLDYPVGANIYVEFSVAVVATNCTPTAYLQCLDASGNAISSITGNTISSGRVWCIGVTPAGTVNVRPLYLVNVASGATPTARFWQAMLALAAAGQTEPSPYVDPGVTTITGGNILTNTIAATSIVANSITAAQIAAGAISTTQLAASAITADKIAVGLGTGNQLPFADCQTGALGYSLGFTNVTGGATLTGSNTDATTQAYAPTYMGSVAVRTNGVVNGASGSPTQSQIMDIRALRPTLGGAYSAAFPVIGGAYYEASSYTSTHRCRARMHILWFDNNDNQIVETVGAFSPYEFAAQGQLYNFARVFQIQQAPVAAAYAYVYTRAYLDQTPASQTNQSFMFTSAWYFGQATSGQTVPSNWAVGSSTIINGGTIATGSITARTITVGTITGDRIAGTTITASNIAAGTITGTQIAANSIYADRIQIGGGQSLTNWLGGTNNTQINGGQIAANSILANSLRVGARGIQLVDVSFYSERDPNNNNNLTNVFCWTGGYVLYTGDDGSGISVRINSGNLTRVGYDAGYWYVFWQKGAGQFIFTQDWGAYLSRQDYVLMVTVSGLTGISVLIGGTIIDGTRITTRSISADQIAANSIQAYNIAAGTITGDRISAGTITASLIAASTITGDKIAGNTITGNHIQANSIQASRLAIGLGGNLIANASGEQFNSSGYQNGVLVFGYQGYLTGYRTDNSMPGVIPFCVRPSTLPPQANQFTYAAFTSTDRAGGYTTRIPVTPNQRYQFSCWMIGYSTSSTVLFVDGYRSDGSGYRLLTDQRGPVGLQQFGGCVTIPGDVVYLSFNVGAYWDGSNNPHLFISAPMVTGVPSWQTDLVPFQNATATTIDGNGIVTNSITTRHLAANTITANSAIIQDLAVGTIKIGSGAVTTAVGASSAAGNSSATLYINVRTPNKGLLITTSYDGVAPERYVSTTDMGVMQIFVQAPNGGETAVKAIYASNNYEWDPSVGGNWRHTLSCSDQYIYTPSVAGVHSIRVAKTGVFPPNATVSVFAVEMAR